MSIKDWPVQLRPREKLVSMGPSALSDAELIALFLRTGVQGKSAVTLAADALENFGGLASLFHASRSRFCAYPGLGPAKYVLFQAAMELAQRVIREDLSEAPVFDSSESVKHYLAIHLRHLQREAFYCLFLNNQHKLIADECLFQGTLNAANVYPREVVKKALEYNAAAVLLAHNHPSGVAEASQADIAITKHLQDALELVDIRVLDHLIVAGPKVFSMAERGLF